ncbi:MAG: hypothetical protein GX766_05330 [Firmicutes bacterium]|jgi:hypothetical protein|nr:hypothetical protein [Bacillota bacterium]HOB22191.1 hypothetical protein [Bacillota bacterium]HQD40558.1 hypothetical protein [Bacillota bacterium]
MPYSAEGSELERLSGLFGQNFLLILFLILIVFLMENQSVFKQGIASLNGKIASFRSMLDAVSATVSALQAVVDAPGAILNPAPEQ